MKLKLNEIHCDPIRYLVNIEKVREITLKYVNGRLNIAYRRKTISLIYPS